MELGEPIAASLFVADDLGHNLETCPWHAPASESEAVMEAHDGDDDAHGPMPDNKGKKLGANLEKAGKPRIVGARVAVYYRRGDTMMYPLGTKTKVLRVYDEAVDEVEYDLQYAPHHLIPGNESLKGSNLIAFLGGDDIIASFKRDGKPSSHVKAGKSVGYDLNCAENGEWLPSPYALSMGNEWPAAEGVKALMKADADSGFKTVAFKKAYASAAMQSDGPKQFHMRHAEYSEKVREILDSMASKVQLFASAVCDKSQDPQGDKLLPPCGLGARLNVLSDKLRTLLTSRPNGWRNPLFADELSREYYVEFISAAEKVPDLRVMSKS